MTFSKSMLNIQNLLNLSEYAFQLKQKNLSTYFEGAHARKQDNRKNKYLLSKKLALITTIFEILYFLKIVPNF